MENGRPADSSYSTHFYVNFAISRRPDDHGAFTADNGLQQYSGQVSKENEQNGYGKYYGAFSELFIGRFKNGRKTEGKWYAMEPDETYTVF